MTAYDIRLHAIREYGLVIHEFDPWFNYRATEYLDQHGLEKFFKWFDYMVWYPLGRPVGTTIYPGMQMTAVFLKNFLNNQVGYEISLNDVCCYIPAWFGVTATMFFGFVDLGVLRFQRKRNSCRGVYYVNCASAYHAIGWWWIRQREHCYDSDDDDILLLGQKST